MTTKTSDEVLQGYVDEFGPDDGPIIAQLGWRVSNLARQWRTFLYFFGGPKERLDVLNEASGRTARMFQNLLWDDVLMSVRRLTDPEKTKKDENLSLEHLVRIARGRDVELNAAHEKMKKACVEARKHATKFLAHHDLNHALGLEESSVSRGQTTQAIKAICGFVNLFHQTLRDTDMRFVPLTPPEDEQQFLLRLFQGNAAAKASEEAKVAALNRGDWRLPDRGEIPDWVWRSRQEDRFLDDLS